MLINCIFSDIFLILINFEDSYEREIQNRRIY